MGIENDCLVGRSRVRILQHLHLSVGMTRHELDFVISFGQLFVHVIRQAETPLLQMRLVVKITVVDNVIWRILEVIQVQF